MTIGPNDGNKWGYEKTACIVAMAKLFHGYRSKERLVLNAMAAVRYRMEDCLDEDGVTLGAMPKTRI